jgi:hypothetical protein
MKPNAKTQMDTTLKFDGAEKETTGRIRSGLMTNQFTGYMNDGREVNFGRGPTRGNQDHAARRVGAPVTRDAYRAAPTAAMPSTRISDPDSINQGSQYRGQGGTQVQKPTNPDQIRRGQSGGPDYGATSKGRRPGTAAGQTDFNYGPKSQY